jgi:hypothetical protein
VSESFDTAAQCKAARDNLNKDFSYIGKTMDQLLEAGRLASAGCFATDDPRLAK